MKIASHRLAIGASVLLAVAGSGAAARGSVIDDFSSSSVSDSANYSAAQLWYNPASAAAPSFTNVGGVFSPSFPAQQTVVWFRTTGETLTNTGDSIGIDFQFNGTNEAALGLSLDSVTSGGPTSNALQILVQNVGNGDIKFTRGPNNGVTGTQSGFSTLTVTDEGGGNFLASVSGGGLSGTQIYTDAASSLYFGPSIYSSGNADGNPVGALDNLSYAAVPEPASAGVMLTISVVALARRRRLQG